MRYYSSKISCENYFYSNELTTKNRLNKKYIYHSSYPSSLSGKQKYVQPSQQGHNHAQYALYYCESPRHLVPRIEVVPYLHKPVRIGKVSYPPDKEPNDHNCRQHVEPNPAPLVLQQYHVRQIEQIQPQGHPQDDHKDTNH